MERGQFTFYASFYKAIRLIRKKSARADAYDAICAFAFEGVEPKDLDMQAAIAFEMARPILETALRKAKSGSIGGAARKSKKEFACDDGESKCDFASVEGESKNKDKKEDKKEDKVKNKCYNTHSGGEEDFQKFWDCYPKKVDKAGARKAFEKVDAPVSVLVQAVEEQRWSGQWMAEGGRYIPNPAGWLSRRGWEDQLPQTGIPKGATGRLGPEELGNIQRLLAESKTMEN